MHQTDSTDTVFSTCCCFLVNFEITPVLTDNIYAKFSSFKTNTIYCRVQCINMLLYTVFHRVVVERKLYFCHVVVKLCKWFIFLEAVYNVLNLTCAWLPVRVCVCEGETRNEGAASASTINMKKLGKVLLRTCFFLFTNFQKTKPKKKRI